MDLFAISPRSFHLSIFLTEMCVFLYLCFQAEFSVTSESPGGIGGRLQSMAGLDGDIYLRGGGGPAASGVLNTGGEEEGDAWIWSNLGIWGSVGSRGEQMRNLGPH